MNFFLIENEFLFLNEQESENFVLTYKFIELLNLFEP